jgi:predicted amidohydrolase
VNPDGSHEQYDKKHLFTFAGEHEHYSPGNNRLIVEYKGWKICPLICYDLRFPVWSRNGVEKDEATYDLLIYVANWPAVRRDPWMKLLYARSIENQCYTLGVNRVGDDGNGISYSGDSMLIDPKGIAMVSASDHEGVQKAELSYEELSDFRKKFPVLNDADKFELK